MLANQFDLFRSVDCVSVLDFFPMWWFMNVVKKCIVCIFVAPVHISTRWRWWGIVPMIKISTFLNFFLFLFKMNSQYWMKTIAFIESSIHLLAIWMIYYRSINSKFDIWSIGILFLFKIYFRYDFQLVLNKEKTNNFQWSSREKSSEF